MVSELQLVLKWQAVKFEVSKKMSVLAVKRTLFFIFKIWRLAILEPVEVQRHNVPHFKVLIMLNLDSKAQVHGSTFTFCYGHLKKVILLVKVATVPLVLLLAV